MTKEKNSNLQSFECHICWYEPLLHNASHIACHKVEGKNKELVKIGGFSKQFRKSKHPICWKVKIKYVHILWHQYGV